MSNDVFNFEEMSLEQLQVMQGQMLQAQLKKIADQLERYRDDQIKYQTKTDIRFDEHEQKTKLEISKVEELAKASLRAKQPKDGWVTMREFGLMYDTTISNRRVGRLLRAVGLAIRGKNTTIPYRDKLGREKYAIREVCDGKSYTLWNYGRCAEHIDMWLEDHGYYTKFYDLVSAGNEKKLEEFIDLLHVNYGK